MAKLRKRTWIHKGETRTAWAVDFTDVIGTRQRRQFRTRREADAFRVEIEWQIRKGTFRVDSTKNTLHDAAELFIEHCDGRMKRGERMTRHNYEVYVGHIRNYICPDEERHSRALRYYKREYFQHGIGSVKLALLTTRVVCEFRDHLRNSGLSVASTRKVLGTLKLILGHAISYDLIAVNVALGVRVITRRGEGYKRIVPPSKEAMRRLLTAADPDFRVQLLFAAMTGVRAGELHALRWRHLDLENGEVTIETRVDAYRREDVTKTAAGMRTVPLGSGLVDELRAWQARSPYPNPDDLVFPNRRGLYVSHDNMVKREFLPLFDKLAALHAENPSQHPKPPARFNWHALRHFAISCWIEAELAPKTIQTFAGHSTLSVTMDRYGHLFKSDSHRQAMNEIARQFVLEEPTRSEPPEAAPRSPKRPEP